MKRSFFALMAILASAFSAAANETHEGHMLAHHQEQTQTAVTEPGQGAFAAISEIVKLLTEDPDTDWSRVDIDALRAHLVDMDDLINRTEVSQEDLDEGLRMTFDLALPANAAALRMVPAHAPVLAGETGWSSEVSRDADLLIWTVRSSERVAQIKALGFFGLMSLGDHHREHHYGLATGLSVH